MKQCTNTSQRLTINPPSTTEAGQQSNNTRRLWKCGKDSSQCNRVIGVVLSAPTWFAISKASAVHFLIHGSCGRKIARDGVCLCGEWNFGSLAKARWQERHRAALFRPMLEWGGNVVHVFCESACAGPENIFFTIASLEMLQQHAGTNLLQASRAARSD